MVADLFSKRVLPTVRNLSQENALCGLCIEGDVKIEPVVAKDVDIFQKNFLTDRWQFKILLND
jgi:hypothetical protein